MIHDKTICFPICVNVNQVNLLNDIFFFFNVIVQTTVGMSNFYKTTSTQKGIRRRRV